MPNAGVEVQFVDEEVKPAEEVKEEPEEVKEEKTEEVKDEKSEKEEKPEEKKPEEAKEETSEQAKEGPPKEAKPIRFKTLRPSYTTSLSFWKDLGISSISFCKCAYLGFTITLITLSYIILITKIEQR